MSFVRHEDHVPARAPRPLEQLKRQALDDDGVPTATSVEQRGVEASCMHQFELVYKFLADADATNTVDDDGDDDSRKKRPFPSLSLQRRETEAFLRTGLKSLSPGYACLDASQPWLTYWIVHAMKLTGAQLDQETEQGVVNFLKRCQNAGGGFGGGPGQLSHLAPTYAAVNALATIGTDSALAAVDRVALVKWMDSLRLDDGSYLMHKDGEVDIRGVYCALSVAKLTNTYSPELFKRTNQWVLSCQTYEGGFGGAPGMEAHGGYTFCGLASLTMLGKQRLCNMDRLLRWTAKRQMKLEGGFQGRTNKLVDGCYSFWQGAAFPLLHQLLEDDGRGSALSSERWLFDQETLQEYLLSCCQDARGGLVDKPGKHRDYYHTCYTLSGLSVAQHFRFKEERNERVLGPVNRNRVAPIHFLHNVEHECALRALDYYGKLEIPMPPEEAPAPAAKKMATD